MSFELKHVSHARCFLQVNSAMSWSCNSSSPPRVWEPQTQQLNFCSDAFWRRDQLTLSSSRVCHACNATRGSSAWPWSQIKRSTDMRIMMLPVLLCRFFRGADRLVLSLCRFLVTSGTVFVPCSESLLARRCDLLLKNSYKSRSLGSSSTLSTRSVLRGSLSVGAKEGCAFVRRRQVASTSFRSVRNE